MKVDLHLSRIDLDHALAELLPTTLWLDDAHTRSLRIDKLAGVVIEARGIRLLAAAELRWQLPGLAPRLSLDRLELWVRPRISKGESGQDSIRFELEVGEAAFRGVPQVMRSGLVTAVNMALDRVALRWGHGAALTRAIALPPLFEHVEALRTVAKSSTLAIDQEGLSFGFELEIGFNRTADA